MLARVFVWQDMAVAHAPAKVADGRLTDQPTIEFIRQPLAEFIETLRKGLISAGSGDDRG
jgi:hypothetical protein